MYKDTATFVVLGAIWRYNFLGVDRSNDIVMSDSDPDADWPRTPEGGYTLEAWDEARRRHYNGIGTQRGNCLLLGVPRSCLKRAISSGVSKVANTRPNMPMSTRCLGIGTRGFSWTGSQGSQRPPGREASLAKGAFQAQVHKTALLARRFGPKGPGKFGVW